MIPARTVALRSNPHTQGATCRFRPMPAALSRYCGAGLCCPVLPRVPALHVVRLSLAAGPSPPPRSSYPRRAMRRSPSRAASSGAAAQSLGNRCATSSSLLLAGGWASVKMGGSAWAATPPAMSFPRRVGRPRSVRAGRPARSRASGPAPLPPLPRSSTAPNSRRCPSPPTAYTATGPRSSRSWPA